MENKLISVVIPTYNENDFIDKCLMGVFNFNLPKNFDIEIIIVDGGSFDGTLKKVKKWISRKSNIILLNNSKKFQNFGINIGIKSSKGKYILRLDAHAEYQNNYLLKCYNNLIKTNSENSGGRLITLKKEDTLSASIVQALSTHKFGVGDSDFRTSSYSGLVDTVPFGFYKKTLFEEIGYLNEELVRGEDYEFNARIRKNKYSIWMDSDIIIKYYNEASFIKFLNKQLLKEGPYNFLMWYLAPYSFSLRHSIPLLFFLGIITGFFLSLISVFIKIIYFSVIAVYISLAIVSSFQQAIKYRDYRLFFLLPLCFFLFHFLYGLGIFIGFLKTIFKHK